MFPNTFRSSLSAAASVVGIAVGIGAAANPVAAQMVYDTSLNVDIVAGLGSSSSSTNMVILGDDDFLIGQKKSGQVVRVLNGTLQPTPVLDLPVDFAGERGLLGMVKHPNFATNNTIYCYYTRAAADGGAGIENRVSRFTWTGTNLINELPIYSLPTPVTIHNGGIIRFGPPDAPAASQKLFVVMGRRQQAGAESEFPCRPGARQHRRYHSDK